MCRNDFKKCKVDSKVINNINLWKYQLNHNILACVRLVHNKTDEKHQLLP